MSSNEIQGMIQIRHHVDDLRGAVDSAVQNDENDEAIRAKADFLLDTYGFTPEQLIIQTEQWREVNRVTTESPTFELNAMTLIDHLQQKES